MVGKNENGKSVTVVSGIFDKNSNKITFISACSVGLLGFDLVERYKKLQLVFNLPQEVDYVSAQIKMITETNNEVINFNQKNEIKYNPATRQVVYTANEETLTSRIKHFGEYYQFIIECAPNQKFHNEKVIKGIMCKITNEPYFVPLKRNFEFITDHEVTMKLNAFGNSEWSEF